MNGMNAHHHREMCCNTTARIRQTYWPLGMIHALDTVPTHSSRASLHPVRLHPSSRNIVLHSRVNTVSRESREIRSFSARRSRFNTDRAWRGRSPSSRRANAEAHDSAVNLGMGGSLLVIGPGVLGGLVGRLYKQTHPEAKVVGQTNTETNHGRLKRLGLMPRLKDAAPADTFDSVVFSAPPSGSADYVEEVRGALHFWDGKGSFIFTSSSGVCNPAEREDLSEATPLHAEGHSERTDRLLKAERSVLEAGGCVVRLVGLYHAHRGAHTFFLRQGEVARWGGHVVNLIHYEDAAALCLRVLEGREGNHYRGQLFFGTDAQPVTFQEMMDATLASGAFQGSVKFTGAAEERPGPASSNDLTRKELAWRPKYESFKAFMASGAKDFYTEFDSS